MISDVMKYWASGEIATAKGPITVYALAPVNPDAPDFPVPDSPAEIVRQQLMAELLEEGPGSRKTQIVVQIMADDMFVAAFADDLKKSVHGPTKHGALINLIERHGQDLFDVEVIDHRERRYDIATNKFEAIKNYAESLPMAGAQKTTGLTWAEAERVLIAGGKVGSEFWPAGTYIFKGGGTLPGHWAMKHPDGRFGTFPGNGTPAALAVCLSGAWSVVETDDAAG